MKALTGARVAHADGHGVGLSLADGATFSVQVLEPSLMRVRYRPASGYKEGRTWAIAPAAAGATTPCRSTSTVAPGRRVIVAGAPVME